MRRLAATALVAILGVGCGPGSTDPTLEVQRFEPTLCPATAEEGVECYDFEVRVHGSKSSDEPGTCRIIAFGKDGAEISTEATLDDLELEPGRTYEEVFELPKMDRDSNFDFWEPECLPTGEG